MSGYPQSFSFFGNSLFLYSIISLSSVKFFISYGAETQRRHVILILEVSRSHTTTHHSRQDSSGRVISSSQRPVPDNTTLTTDRHPCPRRDSNLRTIPANERPQTHTLDRAASGIGHLLTIVVNRERFKLSVSILHYKSDYAPLMCVAPVILL